MLSRKLVKALPCTQHIVSMTRLIVKATNAISFCLLFVFKTEVFFSINVYMLAAGCVVMLIALAFPFFGVINSFLGAGTTTLETYIIPCLAYNLVYWREATQIACPLPPPW